MTAKHVEAQNYQGFVLNKIDSQRLFTDVCLPNPTPKWLI